MPGSRVVVPVRGGRAVGYCLGESDGVALGRTEPKAVLDVPDAEPAFRPDLLAVCRWMSEYYVAPLRASCCAPRCRRRSARRGAPIRR